jgi:hypothetical protein
MRLPSLPDKEATQACCYSHWLIDAIAVNDAIAINKTTCEAILLCDVGAS